MNCKKTKKNPVEEDCSSCEEACLSRVVQFGQKSESLTIDLTKMRYRNVNVAVLGSSGREIEYVRDLLKIQSMK